MNIPVHPRNMTVRLISLSVGFLLTAIGSVEALSQAGSGAHLSERAYTEQQRAHPEDVRLTKPQVLEAYGKLPLSFEVNQGQTDERVDYLARGSGYTLFLTGDEAVVSLRGSTGTPEAVQMRVVGGDPAARVSGLRQQPGMVNYFHGTDPAQWRVNVPTYAEVRYEQVYPGVDLVYYGIQDQLEFDFVVAPGTEPDVVRIAFKGADSLELTSDGKLVMLTDTGELVLGAPTIYQEIDGARRIVQGGYVLQDEQEVMFDLAAYDRDLPVVIDPALSYSTFLGGSGSEGQASALRIDASGNVYIASGTSSIDFPTSAPLQAANAGDSDVYIAKLNSTGSLLLYSTYLGGSAQERDDVGLALDANGSVYVVGTTRSSDFPVTAGAFQINHGGGLNSEDAFVVKLNPAGGALEYATYLGGNADDRGFGVATDASGSAYVTGDTGNNAGNTFPTTTGAFQEMPVSFRDVFVTKLDPAGSALVYSTYIGGGAGNAIAVDTAGNAFVVGQGAFTGFPTTLGAFQTSSLSGSSCFVTKLSALGDTLGYSTLLGGSTGQDDCLDVSIDAAGNAYLTGIARSADFPTTASALQPGFGGGDQDAFVTKLDASGSQLVYSTYLGGGQRDQGRAIAIDAGSRAYVTGETHSLDFPTVNAFRPNLVVGIEARDAFVAQLSPAGSALEFSTYLGGFDFDRGEAIAVDENGGIYVSGSTHSSDFPIKNALQGVRNGIRDSFVSKIDLSLTPEPPVAMADGPYQGIISLSVGFDASTSSDPEGDPLTFSWEFGDGDTLETTEPLIEHTYVTTGTFPVTLVVSDGQLESLPFMTEATIFSSVSGGGGRTDVDAFLAYVTPTERTTTLPAGTASFDVLIAYGETIDPATFEATLNQQPFGGFTPDPGRLETVTIPLLTGRNVLVLSVEGVRTDGRTARDGDRLTFKVE